jgi:hypothetical protein
MSSEHKDDTRAGLCLDDGLHGGGLHGGGTGILEKNTY